MIPLLIEQKDDMSKLVKKRTHRYCHRCGTEVLYEHNLDYPYYCPTCDENMFHFETYRKK